MKKIRNAVFETNSSAVHCIVMPNEYLEKPNLRMTADNKILVDFTEEFDGYLSTQEEKLSYLITQLWYKNGNYSYLSLLEDSTYQMIKKYVCDYVHADDIVIENKVAPYINHQAVWDSYTEPFIDLYDKDVVISFIFSPMMVKEYYD